MRCPIYVEQDDRLLGADSTQGARPAMTTTPPTMTPVCYDSQAKELSTKVIETQQQADPGRDEGRPRSR